MGDNEIKITEFQLIECNGNLKTLSRQWKNVPNLTGDIIKKSEGYSAEDVKLSLDATKQVSNELDTLLNNSILFFENLGISFKESDEAASKYIETISK